MSDAKKLVNRIPFEAIETISNWQLPSLGDPARSIPSAQREAARQGAPQAHEQGEEVAEHLAYKPMTAEQLQAITEEAEREGREQGYQVGLQQGLQEGQKQGQKTGEQKAYNECKARWQDETLRFRQIAERLMAPLEQQEAALENLLVEMALKFAEHLLHKTLNEDPGALYNIVEKAVAGLPAGAKNLRVYLNHDDLELLKTALDTVPSEWSLAVDKSLQRGGCRVESQYSLVDYSVEKRLQQLFEQARALGSAAVDTMAPPADYKPAVPEPPVQQGRVPPSDACLTQEISSDSPSTPTDANGWPT